MHTVFWLENGTYHLGDLDVDGEMILKCLSKKGV
jgi:hypothetical protein